MADLPNHPTSCDKSANRSGSGFFLPFTMAFQPIFDIQSETVSHIKRSSVL